MARTFAASELDHLTTVKRQMGIIRETVSVLNEEVADLRSRLDALERVNKPKA